MLNCRSQIFNLDKHKKEKNVRLNAYLFSQVARKGWPTSIKTLQTLEAKSIFKLDQDVDKLSLHPPIKWIWVLDHPSPMNIVGIYQSGYADMQIPGCEQSMKSMIDDNR